MDTDLSKLLITLGVALFFGGGLFFVVLPWQAYFAERAKYHNGQSQKRYVEYARDEAMTSSAVAVAFLSFFVWLALLVAIAAGSNEWYIPFLACTGVLFGSLYIARRYDPNSYD